MIYSSLYFDTKISNKWFYETIEILDRQLDLQILDDGCHYEKVPCII